MTETNNLLIVRVSQTRAKKEVTETDPDFLLMSTCAVFTVNHIQTIVT